MAALTAALVLLAGGCALPDTAPTGSTATGGTGAAAVRPVTDADLQSGLLGSEVGAGFGPKTSAADEDGARAVFAGVGCEELARWLNAESVPGSRAEAAAPLSIGPGGGAAAEQLYAMDSAHAAAQVVDRYRRAASRCTEITLSVAGVGDSTCKVRPISMAPVGDASSATGVSAGETDGFADQDIIHVVTHSGTVVVAMTFMGAKPRDVETVTEAAVDKVHQFAG